MNRLGWTILALIVLGGLAFGSMLTIGGPRRVPAVRPSVAPASAPAASGPGPKIGDYPQLAVPVAGVSRSQITDNWLDPRGGGTRQHHGTDIMVPKGTPVLAAAPGRIEKLFDSDLGGITLYERSPDGRWQYYYAHLAGYASGLHEGQQVATGQLLGYAGDTGDAGPGNYQLHFGLSYMAPGEGWWQGTPVNPYPLLAGRQK
ncbi:MAG TPA: M23 family metallopeptidase [Sphingomonas sp.]|nr:M23 family metallopeptidase [Sphingomonas sp.]